MSKLLKIIKTTMKEAIIAIINRPIVSSLHTRISAMDCYEQRTCFSQ